MAPRSPVHLSHSAINWCLSWIDYFRDFPAATSEEDFAHHVSNVSIEVCQLYSVTDPETSGNRGRSSPESGEDFGGQVWIDELTRETGGGFLSARISVRAVAYPMKLSEFPPGLARRYQKVLPSTRLRSRNQMRGEQKVVSVDVTGKSVTLECGGVLTADTDFVVNRYFNVSQRRIHLHRHHHV